MAKDINVKIYGDADFSKAQKQVKETGEKFKKSLGGLSFKAVASKLSASFKDTAKKIPTYFKDSLSKIRTLGFKGVASKLSASFKATAKKIPGYFKGLGSRIAGQFKGLGSKLKATISGALKSAVAGVGVGVGLNLSSAIGDSFSKALNSGAAIGKFKASLGEFGEEGAKLAKSAGDLFTKGYADSFDEVATVVGSLKRVVAEDLDAPGIEKLGGQVISMGEAFGGAGEDYVRLAGQLKEQGVTDSVQQGLDLLTVSFQKLPSEIRGDLSDAVSEYSVFTSALGLTTEESFSVLTDAAGRGQFALDKTGDALKELQIRATDMSANSVAAYEAAGLSAEDMAAQVLAGGDQARSAFGDIVDGLLGIKNPTEQANAAIALFGTPLEDLGVDQIPTFLEGLQNMENGMSDVEGAAAKLDEAVTNNLAGKFTALRRGAMKKLVQFMNATLVPAFEHLFNNEGVTQLGKRFASMASAIGGAFSVLFTSLGGPGGGGLSGIFDSVVAGLTEVVGGVTAFFNALQSSERDITSSGFAGAMEKIANFLKFDLFPVLQAVAPIVGKVADAFLKAAGVVGKFVAFLAGNQALLAGIFAGIAAVVLAVLVPAFVAWATAAGAAAVSTLIAAAPFIAIGVAIAAVAAALVYAYKRFEAFRTVVDLVAEGARIAGAWLLEMGNRILAWIQSIDFGPVVAVALEAWDLIATAVSAAWDVISAVVDAGMALIAAIMGDGGGGVASEWSALWDGISQALSIYWETMQAYLSGVLNIISGLIKVTKGIIEGDWSLLWEGVKQVLSGAWQAIAALVTGGTRLMNAVLSTALNVAKLLAARAWAAIVGKARSEWTRVGSTVSNGIDRVVGFVRSLPGKIRAAALGSFDGVIDAVRKAIDRIKSLWDRLSFSPKSASVNVGSTVRSFASGAARRLGLARGGVAFGRRDNVTIGEGGDIGRHNPEITTPEKVMAKVVGAALENGLKAAFPNGAGTGGGLHVGNIYVERDRGIMQELSETAAVMAAVG